MITYLVDKCNEGNKTSECDGVTVGLWLLYVESQKRSREVVSDLRIVDENKSAT